MVVDRPRGRNTAAILVAVVTTPTELHPEGITRVVLCGDPTKALGTVAVPECALVVAAIDLAEARSHGYVFQIELTYRAAQAGFRVVEIPITFGDRAQGRSKMSWRIALEAVVLVPRLRWGRRGRAVGAHMRSLSHMR